MTKPKLTYADKPIDVWTTNDFLAYIADQHVKFYGTEYAPPGRNWALERGLIGTLIGTRGKNAKPRKYEPTVVKSFIDECFRTHRCTPQYPTVSFTWLWKWKTDVWARVLAESQRQAQRSQHVEVADDIDDWL